MVAERSINILLTPTLTPGMVHNFVTIDDDLNSVYFH